MSTGTVSTQIHLASRPTGWPTAENFRTVRVDLPNLAPGQVRVENSHISVDPYMRGRMNDVRSYVPPFAVGEVMTGGAVGEVVASAAEELPVGTTVLHQQGWRDVAQGDASDFTAVQPVPGVPASAFLGVLGMTGLTAWVGLTTIASFRPGDTVFVSGAAGAVGSVVGQIARLLGAKRVIGSAGSAEKVRLLTERYGFDAAFNYKDAPVREQLPAHAPDGVDVYFDNVGGDHLEAALDVMNDDGRAALCGAISQYNATGAAPGPDNLGNLVTRRLTLRGFIVGHHLDHATEYRERMGAWLRDGAVATDETVIEGIDHAVDGFLAMMRGENVGKMLIRTR
ncbi:NADP-dependent oxidoreductase [Tersicoccus phoenicis]|uniref:NADP-dependent oxidoreductase n=1 Tax=Tersicoccus phoenicis TaxID=554083 RepID=A0A1R1LB05_9MICC|nr:NADP-dependent oxidoreductase [Tersicoccus phoenicis]OMH24722.1 NADP-dependent oxidoreductase [Tersicoccus phoenicis]